MAKFSSPVTAKSNKHCWSFPHSMSWASVKFSSSRNIGTKTSGSGVVGSAVVGASVGGCVVSVILVPFWANPASLFRRSEKLRAI